MPTNSLLLYAVLALQALDVASTVWAFRRGAAEANPIMRGLINALGLWPGLLLPKLLFVALVWDFQAHIQAWGLVLVCLVYAAVVANNIKIARSA
jgi:hypothetical protein